MTTWNEALEAYDDECAVLEETRAEYASYLRGVFASVTDRAVAALGSDWAGSVRDDGPRTTWQARPHYVGLRAWASRPWGSAKSSLVLGVDLEVRAGAWGDMRRKKFLERALEKSPDLATGSLPSVELTGRVDGSFVRLFITEIGAAAATACADAVTEMAPLIRALDTLVTRCRWLEEALESTTRHTPPPSKLGATWEKAKLENWAYGRYVELESKEPEHCVWITALPPGRLVLSHFGGPELDTELGRALGLKSIAVEGERDPGLANLLLADEALVERLFAEADPAAIERLAMSAFSEYFRLAERIGR